MSVTSAMIRQCDINQARRGSSSPIAPRLSQTLHIRMAETIATSPPKKLRLERHALDSPNKRSSFHCLCLSPSATTPTVTMANDYTSPSKRPQLERRDAFDSPTKLRRTYSPNNLRRTANLAHSPSNRPRLERRDANESPRKQRSGSPRKQSSASPRKQRAVSPRKKRAGSPRKQKQRLCVETFADAEDSVLSHNFDTMYQFKRRCFLVDGRSALRGFIRRNERVLRGRRVVPGIIALCASYYVDDEAGIFQIGYQLYVAMKKLNRQTLNTKMTTTLLTHFLAYNPRTAITGEITANQLCAELVRSRYLVPLTARRDGGDLVAYRISMEKIIEFSCYSK